MLFFLFFLKFFTFSSLALSISRWLCLLPHGHILETSSFYLYCFEFEASLSVILRNFIDVNGTIAFQMRRIAVDLSD